jgi:hypothetical protein
MNTRTQIATELRDKIIKRDNLQFTIQYEDIDIAKALKIEWEREKTEIESINSEVQDIQASLDNKCYAIFKDIKQALEIIGEVV